MRSGTDAYVALPREPDGNVGPYSFWLGDMFETETDETDDDGSVVDDDAETAERVA